MTKTKKITVRTNLEDLRPILLDRLEKLGWTKNKLALKAAKAGILTRDGANKYLNSQTNITWDKAVKLLKLAGVEVRLCWDEQKEPA